MKKFDWVEVVGKICTIAGIALTIVSNIVEEKKLDTKIDKAVREKLHEMNK